MVNDFQVCFTSDRPKLSETYSDILTIQIA
jgi:hypothetical protein